MSELKITVSGEAKIGKSTILSSIKRLFKGMPESIKYKGSYDPVPNDSIDTLPELVYGMDITLEEVHLPTPTGDVITDLGGLGFTLSHGKDYSNGNNGKEFLCMSLSISKVIDLEVSNDNIYIIAINSSNISRPTILGKYDYYKVFNLINSLKAFK